MDTNQRPLNVTGTQFILPSQIDPAVLAELPADIRSKLAPRQKSILDAIARPRSPFDDRKSRSASPQVTAGELGLPNQSQIDPATLAELPEDVRQELLAHYRASTKIANTNKFAAGIATVTEKGQTSCRFQKARSDSNQETAILIYRHEGSVEDKSDNDFNPYAVQLPFNVQSW